jgi:hypothetical protein
LAATGGATDATCRLADVGGTGKCCASKTWPKGGICYCSYHAAADGCDETEREIELCK